VPGTASEEFTKEAARHSAEARRRDAEKERRYTKPLGRVAKWAVDDGFEPIFSSTDFVGNGEEQHRFENYVSR
jgi:hypothetical protein